MAYKRHCEVPWVYCSNLLVVMTFTFLATLFMFWPRGVLYLIVHQKPLDGLSKMHLAGSHPQSLLFNSHSGDGAQKFTLAENSQLVLMLLVYRPHLENHWSSLPSLKKRALVFVTWKADIKTMFTDSSLLISSSRILVLCFVLQLLWIAFASVALINRCCSCWVCLLPAFYPPGLDSLLAQRPCVLVYFAIL